MTGVRPANEESIAAHGARWIAVGMVPIGLSNYGYSLLLTHLLNVTEYSAFAAGQGLILWATTIATVSVPWVLAQALVRARTDAERNSAIRFAKLTSAATGIIAAAIVGTIVTRFAESTTAFVVGISTFIIILGTTTTGWLQGQERMRSLSLLYITENVLKNGVGILLVVVAGLGGNGALAAFGVGGIAMLARWPRTRRASSRSWRELIKGDLWHHAIASAGVQGLVSLFVAVDVVAVALLPGNRALAASYQASATLTRIPLYVAGAVATAFFPLLSRNMAGGMIAARAVRMYTAVGLPLMVVFATIPVPVLTTVFPTEYGAVAVLIKYTAVTGLAAGGISLIAAFFQAANDYSCLRWLGGGFAGYVSALLIGWRVERRHWIGGRCSYRCYDGSNDYGLPASAEPRACGICLGAPSRAFGGSCSAYCIAIVSVALAGSRVSSWIARSDALLASGSPPRTYSSMGYLACCWKRRASVNSLVAY